MFWGLGIGCPGPWSITAFLCPPFADLPLSPLSTSFAINSVPLSFFRVVPSLVFQGMMAVIISAIRLIPSMPSIFFLAVRLVGSQEKAGCCSTLVMAANDGLLGLAIPGIIFLASTSPMLSGASSLAIWGRFS